jgi:hypothetical protein
MISRSALSSFVVLGLSGAVALISAEAQAQCEQSAVSASDQAFADTMPKNPLGVPLCPEDYMRHAVEKWLYASGNWENRGLFDACNNRFQFAKHWTATYVVHDGISFELVAGAPPGPVLLLDRAFHASWEYVLVGRGMKSVMASHYRPPQIGGTQRFGYHVIDFKHYAAGYDSTSPGTSASYQPDSVTFGSPDERLTTYCPVYDPNDIVFGGELSSITSRASAFVHEGWHAHFRFVDSMDHQPRALQGFERFCDGSCDTYFPHGKQSFAEGDLWRSTVQSNTISVYQLEHEFLCDVTDRPAAWVPNAIREEAAIEANYLATKKFVRGALPYTCGLPTPFNSPITPTRESFLCEPSTFCETDSQCTGGDTCNNNCCGTSPEQACADRGAGPACTTVADCPLPPPLYNACDGCCITVQ